MKRGKMGARLAAVLAAALVVGSALAGNVRWVHLTDEAGRDFGDILRAATASTPGYLDLYGAGGTHRIRLTAAALTANRTLTLGNADVNLSELSGAFSSTETQASGSDTVIAHDLGRAPRIWWTEVTQGHDGAGDTGDKACTVFKGASNASSITVRVTQGCEYIVHAM